MDISSLLLGHFNSTQPFYLYRIANTNILLFKLTDVCSFFNLPSANEVLAKAQPTDLFYRDVHQHQDIYLTTSLLATLAIKHNKFLLAELCKLKPSDYAANFADSILTNIPRLESNKVKKDASQYQATHIELVESSLSDTHTSTAVTTVTAVKSEPISPPPMLPSVHKQQSDPMAIDTMLSHSNGGAGSQQSHQQTRRLSRTLEDLPNKKLKTNNLLPKPIHTVSSQQQDRELQQPQPPTLLAKRLNNSNYNKKNLTIYAPSYGEKFISNSIRSAPLNSNFLRQQQQQKGGLIVAQPHPLSQTTLRSPATASTTTTEFAIPPIVPSQQQPPHTAHPSSNHFPPHSPQYPSSAYGHSFPVTSGRVVVDQIPSLPKTPTSSLQKQQFMQPFEHLFDTIETTRTLKSTLDDQIRRSSTLMQTLQASSTTIEGLVRNQIKEAQKEILLRMEDSLDHLFQRITVLERRSAATSRGISNGGEPMQDIEEEDEEEDVERQVESTSAQIQEQRRRELVSPPTIVKSQNDIGPNEYHVMLDTLRERLDRLERQLES